MALLSLGQSGPALLVGGTIDCWCCGLDFSLGWLVRDRKAAGGQRDVLIFFCFLAVF